MTKNALKSLYGTGHADAAEKGKGIRNQVVLTPTNIIEGLEKFWPEGILYDAASDLACHIACEDGTGTRGLIDPWPDRSYCNPPYGTSLFDPVSELDAFIHECQIRKDHRETSERWKARDLKPPPLVFPEGLPIKPKAGLKDWLKMQITKSEGESIMLVPNRTHRKWFRDWRRQVTALVELDPVTFHRWSSSCPFPLVLGLRVIGRDTNKTAARIGKFHEAFAHVGDPV